MNNNWNYINKILYKSYSIKILYNFWKRKKIKKILRRIYKNNNLTFYRKRYTYFSIQNTANIEFFSNIPYRLFQLTNAFIRRKFFNLNYFKKLLILKKNNSKLRYRAPALSKFFTKKRLKVIWYFLYSYQYFFFSTQVDVFYLYKQLNNKKTSLYTLFLKFIKNRLFINLQSDKKKKTYLFVSSGFFLKFFDRKKSFKKNKLIKMLMAKFLRKFFLITKITSLTYIIKGAPILLLEFLKILNTKIAHKFYNPLGKTIINESAHSNFYLSPFFFIFHKSTSYSLNKLRKIGRIKRKVLRKIIFENKLVD